MIKETEQDATVPGSNQPRQLSWKSVKLYQTGHVKQAVDNDYMTTFHLTGCLSRTRSHVLSYVT